LQLARKNGQETSKEKREYIYNKKNNNRPFDPNIPLLINTDKKISKECVEEFSYKALDQVNMYRRRHQLPHLTINKANGKNVAMPFAKLLSDFFEFKPNPNLISLNLGENKYQKTSPVPFTFSISECQGIFVLYIAY
jgi:hypothetical protein